MIIKRVGGKTKLSAWMVGHMPTCAVFVDVFGGSGAVLDEMVKHRTRVRYVYNDLDRKVYAFFRAIKRFDIELSHYVELTPYSRQVFGESYKAISNHEVFDGLNDVEKALVFLVVNRQSFGAKMGPTWSITRDGEINYKTWGTLPYLIQQCHRRWKNVYLENDDYKRLIARWDSPQTAFYLDPPYEDGEDDYYEVNKDDGFDHDAMFDVLSGIEGSFCVSYYGGATAAEDTELVKKYAELGCRVERHRVAKHLSASDRKESAIEVLIIKTNEWSRTNGRIYKGSTGKSMREIE